MKKHFALSLLLHLGLGLLLALWICPWFEQVSADRHATIDIDIHANPVVGGPIGKGQRSIKVTAPTRLAEPKSLVPPVNTQNVAASNPTEVSSQSIDQVVNIDGGDGKPLGLSIPEYFKWVRTHNAFPVYPRLARIRGEQGRVRVRIIVNQSESPLEGVELVESSGSELLDKVTLDALRSWVFPRFHGPNMKLSYILSFNFSFDKQGENAE